MVFGIRHLSGANECTDISSTLWCHTPPMCQEYATPVRLAGVVLERERDAGKCLPSSPEEPIEDRFQSLLPPGGEQWLTHRTRMLTELREGDGTFFDAATE